MDNGHTWCVCYMLGMRDEAVNGTSTVPSLEGQRQINKSRPPSVINLAAATWGNRTLAGEAAGRSSALTAILVTEFETPTL